MSAVSQLERLIPAPDVRSRHIKEVNAPPDAVTRAVEAYRIDRDASVATRLLLRLRGLSVPGGTLQDALEASGFRVLVERPGEEFVAATVGRFWALKERANIVAPSDLAAFRTFDRPASAIAAMNLRWEPLPGGRTLISTETRVRCTDAAGRRRFRVYWTIIRAFSGVIRRDLLREIAARAEALSVAPVGKKQP